MTSQPSSDTYPAFRSGRERIALGLVLLAVLGLPLAVFGVRHLQAAGPVRVIELTARLPTAEQGGWTPEVITVRRGERVKLRISSEDVVHGFSIPKLGIDVDWIEPGKVTEVEFVADRPGRYGFQCTVWCQLGHWRMRGLLEVVDPGDPVASARDVDPPATDWVSYGIDIDAEHPGQYFPETQPSSAGGGQLWESISSRPLAELVATLPMRQLSPSDLFAYLSSVSAQPPVATPHAGHDAGGSSGKGDVRLPALPEAAALAGLSAARRWDIVAALYAAATTPQWLARGAALYERDCTGCHGVSGRGDGPGAAALAQAGRQGAQHAGMAMEQSPVDFTDRAAQAGASDLLYYGKLVRGGMGTSMPYWGTLYTEDELWAVIAHLRSFAFDLPD